MTIEQTGDEVIEVKVRVYASLRSYLPGVPLGQSVSVRLSSEATIGDTLEGLGIPKTETKNCFVNGIQREFDYPLRAGDELAVFPPVGGG